MVNWIIQQNLIKPAVLAEFRNAFQQTRTPFEEVYVIPFSVQLPEIRNYTDFPVFYGTNSLTFNALKHPFFRKGVFFSTEDFQIKNFIEKWSNKMLNYDSVFMSLEKFVENDYASDSQWFVRPNEDSKTFSGTIKTFQELQEWYHQLKISDTIQSANQKESFESSYILTVNQQICFAQPKKIDKEWRNFIVNKQVVSATRYLKHGELSISGVDIPAKMLEFVANCCEIYIPHPIFVMDVALSEGNYYILECNCFNSTGFYQHDIKAIVKAVNQYILENLAKMSN
jgi:hypothetical protein